MIKPNLNVNGNHEITTQKQRRNFFSPLQDLNSGFLEQKSSMLPMSYPDLQQNIFYKWPLKSLFVSFRSFKNIFMICVYDNDG